MRGEIMALTAYELSEIQRKAKAGEALSAPTQEKINLYNQVKSTGMPIVQIPQQPIKPPVNATPQAMGTVVKQDIAGAVPVAPVQTAVPAVDPYLAKAKELEDAKLKSSLATLAQNRTTALSGIDAEKTALPQRTLSTVTQARVSGANQARSLKEYMAQRFGTSASGTESQALIQQGVATQGLETQAGLQEQADLSALERQRQAIETAYTGDVASATSGAEANQLQNVLNRTLSQEELARTDKTRAEELASTQEAQKKQDFLNTIQSFSSNFQAEIDKISNDNDTSNDWKIPYLKTARAEKIANQESATAKSQQAQYESQVKAEDAAYDRAMKLWQESGVASKSISDILGVPVGSKTSDKAYKDAQTALNARKESRISSGSSGGSSSGSSTKVDSTNTKITPTQQYTDFKLSLYDSADKNPSAALQDLLSAKNTILSLKGQKEYDELYSYIQNKLKLISGQQYR